MTPTSYSKSSSPQAYDEHDASGGWRNWRSRSGIWPLHAPAKRSSRIITAALKFWSIRLTVHAVRFPTLPHSNSSTSQQTVKHHLQAAAQVYDGAYTEHMCSRRTCGRFQSSYPRIQSAPALLMALLSACAASRSATWRLRSCSIALHCVMYHRSCGIAAGRCLASTCMSCHTCAVTNHQQDG